jgi:hypothetical protein
VVEENILAHHRKGPCSNCSPHTLAGELEQQKGITMSQHVITIPRPSVSFWRRRSFVAAAVVVLLAAGTAAAIGTLVSSDSSTTNRSAPAVPAECSSAGHLDGSYLHGVIASLPDGAGAAMFASLSPQVQQQVAEAVYVDSLTTWQTGPTRQPGTMADAPTLAMVLTRLGAADRDVVFGALPSQLQADVGASLDNVAFFSPC